KPDSLGAAGASQGTTIADGATLQDAVGFGTVTNGAQQTIAEPITFGPGSNGATFEMIDQGVSHADTLTSQLILSNAKSTLQVDRLAGAGDVLNVSGQVVGTGTLTKTGAGFLQLSSTVPNAYANTAVLAGELDLTAAAG